MEKNNNNSVRPTMGDFVRFYDIKVRVRGAFTGLAIGILIATQSSWGFWQTLPIAVWLGFSLGWAAGVVLNHLRMRDALMREQVKVIEITNARVVERNS